VNRLQAMEVFVEVVDRESFSRAAHALHMAASTVTFHIANLEAHIGSTLLNRTTRSFTLTDEGVQYYELCKRVLGDISEVEGSLKHARTTPSGRLRVDIASTFSSSLLLPVMAEFLEAFPDINIDFTDSGHQFDTEQIGADIMVRNPLVPLEDSRLVAIPIGSTPAVNVASPTYLALHGEPATPHDLLKHQCIGYIDPWSGRHWEWFFEHNGKRISIEVPQRLAYSDGRVRVEAALKGLGVINDLVCNIKKELHDGKLKVILEDWTWVPPPLHIIYPQTLRRSKKVIAFVKFLLEKYPPDRDIDPPIA
jgi:LysR family transcriptional regulator for bpeEF and oprC